MGTKLVATRYHCDGDFMDMPSRVETEAAHCHLEILPVPCRKSYPSVKSIGYSCITQQCNENILVKQKWRSYYH